MRAQTKVVSAEEAISQIPSGSTLAFAGFIGAGHPEALSAAIERHFIEGGTPRDLTILHAAGQGDTKDRGLNHLAHEGLVRRVIGGHWKMSPKLGRLAYENKIEAYNFPQGVISVLFREIAAKRPGVFTKVGLNSFVDPVNGGGRLNGRTTQDLVERIRLADEDWLWYHTMPINVGLIRGTRADRKGNIALGREAMITEVLPIAQAAKNHGGIVIAQVEEIVDCIKDPKSVRVPGLLVDYLVVAEPGEHPQTFAEQYNAGYVEHGAKPVVSLASPGLERIVIGRRALEEISVGDVVNLGIGLPEMVALAAQQAGRLDEFTLTVESGPSGGTPASGLSFGCSLSPEAIIDQPSQFDFYDGGGLDIAVLGAVEIDQEGSVCVSRFGSQFVGVGGFLNICRSARKLVFCSTFRASGLVLDYDGQRLKIANEGRHTKFVRKVAEVCFHGPSAVGQGQQVLYVTERAVFQLTRRGMELIEVAPGLSAAEIQAGMEFTPVSSRVLSMSQDFFRTT